MSDGKFTKGEWKAYGGGKRRLAVGAEGGGNCICQLTRRLDKEEENANARLIAAAPTAHAILTELREKFREAEADSSAYVSLFVGNWSANLAAYFRDVEGT